MSQDGANMALEGAEPRAVGSIVRNRYRILSIVGRGGLGVVYRVSDIHFGSNNIFALKELSDPAPGARQQFQLESRWLQALDHNNIPRVRESFEWEGRSYLVMDFVDGENLEQYLRRLGHPLSEDQTFRWMLPICDALQYLHTRTPPLLHRDVKPANIIVTPDGHPVLVDFGIAKAHLPGMNQTLTFVRKAGTEGYAPPEQYAATGLTGPWSDVYALGATVYQLLTGQVPQTAVERITGVSPMPSPRKLNPAITPLADAAIMRALELKPANRYQTVTEFAAQMMEALQLSRFASSGPDVAPLASGATVKTSSVEPVASPSPAAPVSPPPAPTPRPGVLKPVPFPFAGPRPPAPPAAVSLPPLGAPLPSNLSSASGGPVSVPAYPSPSPTAPWPGPASMAALPQAAPIASPGAGRTSSPAITSRSLGASLADVKIKRRGLPLSALIGVLVVLMLALGGLAALAYNNFAPPDRSTPQASVTGYFNALEKQNYALAWQYSSASRNDPSSQASFTSQLSADDARYGTVVSFTVASTDSDTSGHTDFTVNVTRSKSPGTPLTYVVTVAQYSGPVWLIDSASSQ